ncbi:MAG TPA: FAD-dependent oxidoreductase, partial [Thermoplasmata archaeon]|nr:FAD-dependent oxidoreductase [Thermoplasmata archaeon]
MTDPTLPVVVLGAGYAGVRLVHDLSRRTKGGVPIVLVDRHPVHVVRTELYELGELAEKGSNVRKWAIPIDKVVGRRGATYRQGEVESLDLAHSTVIVSGEVVPYGSLALGLGSVPAFYGVPGAESLHRVYRLSSAMRLAKALRDAETGSSKLAAGARVRVAVVGGGSTGTEVAAEIATADWRQLSGSSARPPSVTL